ncbi:GPI-anchored wall transfer protein, putative [Ricinus communis]|uniref:GPI-anchored wall transfer protein, putative n=1 Tax=Ricinus communis TaxID=3988 RepID=B9S6K9_RICCO|nr:GPI-anchored wall transfer protein, putative [Ricinus communis]
MSKVQMRRMRTSTSSNLADIGWPFSCSHYDSFDKYWEILVVPTSLCWGGSKICGLSGGSVGKCPHCPHAKSMSLCQVLADWTFISAILLMALIFSIAAKRAVSSTSNSQGSLSLRAHVSSYRVLVMVVTCLCILAVDFRIYPRRYAKTETYGTSVMDLGVGSFILANSLVSRQARSVSLVNLKTTIQSVSPLLFLGFGRLLSTKTVDYQVHIGEYGMHWNFFFTLAAVSILTSMIRVPPKYSGILGLAILIGYQFWLNNGLNGYLLSNKRGAGIISKNKEGVFSILGYWGMYLLGVQLGYHLFFGNHPSAANKSNNWARIRVLFLSVLFWLITLFLDRHVERVSRRMCNLAYVTLVLAQNLQVLAILMLSDFIAGSKISVLEEAIDRNLLGTFLLANVLTGLVNLSVDTLFATSPVALFILIVYAYVLSIIAGIVHFSGIRLRFW